MAKETKSLYNNFFQHHTFFEAKAIAINICNLQLICQFISQ